MFNAIESLITNYLLTNIGSFSPDLCQRVLFPSYDTKSGSIGNTLALSFNRTMSTCIVDFINTQLSIPLFSTC